MKQEEIIEGNKLIAEFMGWEKSPYENLPNKMYKNDLGVHISQLKYNSDWNWLMEVVETIEDLNYDVEIKHSACSICNSENGYEQEDGGRTKIESVFLMIVRFIKWHKFKR